jgi:hypothetical protein
MATKHKEITLEDFSFAPGELEKLVTGARKLAQLPDDATYGQMERAEEQSKTEKK